MQASSSVLYNKKKLYDTYIRYAATLLSSWSARNTPVHHKARYNF